MTGMLIKKFNQISKIDTKIAGGKGASLGEMTQANISIPGGFVILSNVFDVFIEKTDLNIEIDAVLDTVDINKVHTVENASERIKAMILSKEIPKNIETKILKNFKKLGSKFVAVRSSATAEDSITAAWAGQLESYLNTTGKTLLENVKKCWSSLFSPRAIFYRFNNKLDKKKISVAVVIQKMVQAKKSGIAFSVHPITEDKNQIIIEAGFGLGEAIVSGSITPDSYVIDKQGLKIIDINVNEQKKALYKKAGGGNEWKKLGEKGKKQVLSGKEIVELSKLIMKIEKLYGFPCDIEWAKEKNHFYITQSRPITTLPNTTKRKQTILNYIKGQKWFFGVRADESLLFYSAKQDGCNEYIKKEYGAEFAETLLIPLLKNRPIRVFNLSQAKKFHEFSNKKILKNPRIILTYIAKNNRLYQEMESNGKRLATAIKNCDYHKSAGLFNKICNLYKVAGAQYIIIFSLGLKLTENINNLKNIGGIVQKHDEWRNSVAFKEEELGENLFYFFKFLSEQRKLEIAPHHFMKLLTLNEINNWLNEKLTDAEIRGIIKSRKQHGFIYLNLNNERREIIDSSTEIKKIQKYFFKLDRAEKKSNNPNIIKGQTACGSNEIIKGKVIVIKDKSELKNKSRLIKGKILVAIQTTPHFIPYMKNAKAIITDEGGLTCHAAIVAREFNKPCIIGTGTATHILKDGDAVELEMNDGTIKIIIKK